MIIMLAEEGGGYFVYHYHVDGSGISYLERWEGLRTLSVKTLFSISSQKKFILCRAFSKFNFSKHNESKFMKFLHCGRQRQYLLKEKKKKGGTWGRGTPGPPCGHVD